MAKRPTGKPSAPRPSPGARAEAGSWWRGPTARRSLARGVFPPNKTTGGWGKQGDLAANSQGLMLATCIFLSGGRSASLFTGQVFVFGGTRNACPARVASWPSFPPMSWQAASMNLQVCNPHLCGAIGILRRLFLDSLGVHLSRPPSRPSLEVSRLSEPF